MAVVNTLRTMDHSKKTPFLNGGGWNHGDRQHMDFLMLCCEVGLCKAESCLGYQCAFKLSNPKFL